MATCRWGPNAERAIQNAHPQVTQIDFREYLDVQVGEQDAKRPVQEPWPLQAEAIEDAVAGLANHDRCRLIMACGTGKTFTALRIAEQLVEDGQRILFAAPTIALVSQARREWLRQTTRELSCVVVCSDPTAGGRNENEDIRISELECPVSTDKDAFDQTCDMELLPMRQAEECEVRRVIDEAAGLALGVEQGVLVDWRQRLAAEPTITNARAAEGGSDERSGKISVSVG